MYGPFSDGTVQTYFRRSPVHGKGKDRHYDFELVTPKVGRDKVVTIDHVSVKDK